MPKLVFDIGMHNGDDTAYYLRRGYNVVAVEANPALCTAARERFAAAVADGSLVIHNVGIAAEEGELEFWVSDRSEWSSFSHANATKQGVNARSMAVRTLRFGQLLEQHGAPFFLKIDIEGNDRMCLEDLTDFQRPRALSIEMSHIDGGTDIELLSKLDYRAFKCIRQNDFFEMRPENIWRQVSLRKLLSNLGRVSGPLRRLGHRRLRANGWRFPPGSSGPLAQDLPGRWITSEEMFSVWQRLHDIDLELEAKGVGEWFDVHATLDPSARLA